jgi:signal transduction histidine kinase/phage shock protein PspC (stress-responsive transcriptional regulator)
MTRGRPGAVPRLTQGWVGGITHGPRTLPRVNIGLVTAATAAHQPAPGARPGSGAGSDPGPPRFRRRSDGRLIAGVASGLADHLGVEVVPVRIAFALLAGLSGFGVFVYLALWVFTTTEESVAAEQAGDTTPAGLAAASRAGMRPGRSRRSRTGDLGQLVALAVLGIGVALLVQNTPFGISAAVFFPLLLAGLGLALIWRTADETERRRMASLSPRAPWVAGIAGSGSVVGWIRVVVGVLVVGAGLVAFLAGQGQLSATLNGLLGVLVVVAGLALILGPWLWRLWRELQSERHQRIISQERADMAAHLHDSVLQTLALIQKQAGDAKAVVALARRQERDLRTWLYGETKSQETSLAAALASAAAEVEDAFGVPVEVVTVGDADLDEHSQALVAAAREAVVNAAKHSGAAKVDLFVEATPDDVEVFVRDRGTGFDPADVPEDRLGLRRSVRDRMERHGGTADVRSSPGEGTEVRLSMRRTP